MNLYPASKDYSDALYQVARLQQEEFNEYNEATVSFRKFLKMFPEHKYVEYAQYRIATEAIRRAEVTDDNNGIKIAKAMALIDLFGKNLSLFSSKEILTNILDKEKIDISSEKANSKK